MGSCFSCTWRSFTFRETLCLLSVIILSVASDKKPDPNKLKQNREHAGWYNQAVQRRLGVASGMVLFKPQMIQLRPNGLFSSQVCPSTQWALRLQDGCQQLSSWGACGFKHRRRRKSTPRQRLIASHGLWLNQETVPEPVIGPGLYVCWLA